MHKDSALERLKFILIRRIGPAASFDVTNDWVDRPDRDGLALVGDAAATGDPVFGQRLSLRSVLRAVLRDERTSSSDWHRSKMPSRISTKNERDGL